MHEIIAGTILILAGSVGAIVSGSDDAFLWVAGCVVVGIGLIWNGVGIRERAKNKPPKDRPYLDAP